MASDEQDKELLVGRHVKYCRRVLGILPSDIQSLDTSRMTILFFGLSGLDLLDSLSVISDEDKREMIEWIYSQQVLPDHQQSNLSQCGFRGASFLGPTKCYNSSHIAMSYTALACLLILGDDLSRVNRAGMAGGMRSLQQEDGSYCSTAEGTENDLRFVYCAASVCYMLNDWSGMDVDKAVEFIKSSQSHEGGLSQGPLLEAHGGSTFCGVASLWLMGRLDQTFSHPELESLKRWCIRRQQSGFNGRPNKPVDTCYSFWIGASLQLLSASDIVDRSWNKSYLMSCQCGITGGFSKWPDCHPDPLHTYLGLCALSLNGQQEVGAVNAALNISTRAVQWLTSLQKNNTTVDK